MSIVPDRYILRLVPDQGADRDDLDSLVSRFADVVIEEKGRRALTITCNESTHAALQDAIESDYSGVMAIDPYEGLKLI